MKNGCAAQRGFSHLVFYKPFCGPQLLTASYSSFQFEDTYFSVSYLSKSLFVMCVYNGRRVSLTEFIRLKEMEKSLKALETLPLDMPVQHGYDYRDWPIVKPTADKKGIDVVFAQWELLPPWLEDGNNMRAFRDKYNTLNARGETITSSDMFKHAALKGRCLVISSGFYEHRHIKGTNKRTGEPLKTPKTYPYYITLPGQEYFYMAGITQEWTDHESGETYDTFAIVTTEANSLMKQVHNSKNRMPTILQEDLAYDWLFKDLTEAETKELATYQYPAEKMQAYSVRKDFKSSLDPTEQFKYDDLPQLV